jgi:hypothetical protein
MPPSKPYEWDSYDEADSKGISHPTDQTEWSFSTNTVTCFGWWLGSSL